MSKKIILILLVIIIAILLATTILVIMKQNTANNENIVESNNKIEEQNTKELITQDIIEDDQNNTERIESMKLYIKVNDRTLTATLNDNSSAKALVDKLQNGSVTIDMEDYSNMEKVGDLGFNLPRNDESISTEAGDLILYQGNSFVIYYDNNNWSLTRLGHIDNITQKELKEILGTGSVKVTLSIEE